MIENQFDDSSDLRRLLADRVGGLSPDLASRASRAIVLGRRMRRRRRLAATSAGVAGVAAVGVVGVQLAATPGTGSPSPAPAASNGATAAPTCMTQADARHLKESLATRAQAQTSAKLKGEAALKYVRARAAKGTLRNELRSVKHVRARDRAYNSHLRIDLCGTGSGSALPPEELPVVLKAPGWTCQPPADEKFVCTSGSESALVVVRPAAYHEDYLTDPDKAEPGQYVSPVHGDVFATIESKIPGLADQLSAYLVWK
jgi:hypothetical protein